MEDASPPLPSGFSYEVFGKVQGVFFRKHTAKTGNKFGLVGWVQNTARETVVGEVFGDEAALVAMRKWLESKGSPKSRIDRAVFKDLEADAVAEGLGGKFAEFVIIR
eukprot:g1580.t1